MGPLLDGALDDTDRCIGVVDEHEWLARQHRVSFARVGVIEPTDLAAYREHGGLRGLQRALALSPEQVVAEVTASGLRGRGGAGFPAGIKWETVRTATADVKFVCCNADEGDSGTFADRMLIEGDPFTLIEGMTIAALAVGATEGYVYLRSEYPHAVRTLRRAIDIAYAHGVLGESVLGSGRWFDLDVRVGAGAYICGEETSMLESLEGKRGEVRAKPPIPALEGLFGRPTVVNNVLTLGRCRWCSPTAARRMPRWAPGAHAAPRCSSSPATSPVAASSRPTSGCRSVSSSRASAAARHPGGR